MVEEITVLVTKDQVMQRLHELELKRKKKSLLKAEYAYDADGNLSQLKLKGEKVPSADELLRMIDHRYIDKARIVDASEYVRKYETKTTTEALIDTIDFKVPKGKRWVIQFGQAYFSPDTDVGARMGSIRLISNFYHKSPEPQAILLQQEYTNGQLLRLNLNEHQTPSTITGAANLEYWFDLKDVQLGESDILRCAIEPSTISPAGDTFSFLLHVLEYPEEIA